MARKFANVEGGHFAIVTPRHYKMACKFANVECGHFAIETTAITKRSLGSPVVVEIPDHLPCLSPQPSPFSHTTYVFLENSVVVLETALQHLERAPGMIIPGATQ